MINKQKNSIKEKAIQSSNTKSPETLREITHKKFNFSDYTKNLLLQDKDFTVTQQKQSFLEWFVGFSEGDGSFISTTNGRIMFVINQKENFILQKIQQELSFGTLSCHGTYSRYTVADKVSLLKLISIFNGNLCLKKTNLRFSHWLDYYNKQNKHHMIIPHKGALSLTMSLLEESAWLAGFIDAEGCFNVQKIVDNRYSLGYRVGLP